MSYLKCICEFKQPLFHLDWMVWTPWQKLLGLQYFCLLGKVTGYAMIRGTCCSESAMITNSFSQGSFSMPNVKQLACACQPIYHVLGGACNKLFEVNGTCGVLKGGLTM